MVILTMPVTLMVIMVMLTTTIILIVTAFAQICFPKNEIILVESNSLLVFTKIQCLQTKEPYSI